MIASNIRSESSELTSSATSEVGHVSRQEQSQYRSGSKGGKRPKHGQQQDNYYQARRQNWSLERYGNNHEFWQDSPHETFSDSGPMSMMDFESRDGPGQWQSEHGMMPGLGYDYGPTHELDYYGFHPQHGFRGRGQAFGQPPWRSQSYNNVNHWMPPPVPTRSLHNNSYDRRRPWPVKDGPFVKPHIPVDMPSAKRFRGGSSQQEPPRHLSGGKSLERPRPSATVTTAATAGKDSKASSTSRGFV